jgi:formate hydrogenlyase subunit 4
VTTLLAKIGLQLLLLLLVAPLLSGIIKTLKARLQTRRGPGVLQSYRDIFKLFRKGMVIPETASWIFSATPYIVFVTAALVGLMIPMTTTDAPLSLFGGVLAVVYLLALGRFFSRPWRAGRGQLFWRPRQQPGNDDFGHRRTCHDARDFHGSLGSEFHKSE